MQDQRVGSLCIKRVNNTGNSQVLERYTKSYGSQGIPEYRYEWSDHHLCGMHDGRLFQG
jgi:hypothetical protein